MLRLQLGIWPMGCSTDFSIDARRAVARDLLESIRHVADAAYRAAGAALGAVAHRVVGEGVVDQRCGLSRALQR